MNSNIPLLVTDGKFKLMTLLQGVARLSLISPTRVIGFSFHALIEFELHASTEDEANGGDGPIIEGCTELYNMVESKSFIEHRRLYGERCALDIKFMVLMNAVEARVEVKVLRLGAIDGGVNLRLLAKTSGFSEVIRLFRGAAPKLGIMMSFAIAVKRHSGIDLYIEGFPGEDPTIGQKVVPTNARWKYSFVTSYHRTDEVVAELGEFASVSVKVTWKSYRKLTSQGSTIPSLKFYLSTSATVHVKYVKMYKLLLTDYFEVSVSVYVA